MTNGGNVRGTNRGRAMAALLMGSVALASLAVPAQAQSGGSAAASRGQARAFDIASQPLSTALTIFGDQTGIQITGDTAILDGKRSQTVRGSYAPAEALSLLLGGTGVTFRWLDSRSVSIERAPQVGEGAIQLGPVRVEGEPVSSGGLAASRTAEDTHGPGRGFIASRATTALRTGSSIVETPQSISVVTRAQIDSRAVTSISEVIEYLPGINPNTNGVDSRYDFYSSRSFDAPALQDGLRNPTSTFANPRFEPYGIDRLEFLRGPASVMYGNGSFGGVQNLISKRPTTEPRGEVRARLGSRERWGLAGDVSGPLDSSGALLYRLTAMHEQGDLRNDETRENRIFVAPAMTWNIGSDTTLTLLGEYLRDRTTGNSFAAYQYPAGTPFSAIDFTRAWGEKDFDRFFRNQYSIAYAFDHSFTDRLSFHQRFRHAYVDIDYRSSYLTGLLPNGLGARGADFRLDKAVGQHVDSYLRLGWAVGRLRNETIAGIDYQRSYGNFRSGSGAFPGIDLVTLEPAGQFVLPTLTSTSRTWNRHTGAYLQNQTWIDEKLVVLIGARQDWYRRRNGNATVTTSILHQNAFTGRIGAVWLDDSGFAPYVSYTEAFSPQGGTDRLGTPFKPITGHQYEAGLRYEPPGTDIRLSAAVYDARRQNQLTPDPVNNLFSIQTGEVKATGLELEAVGSLPGGWNLNASYTYIDGKVTKSERPGEVGLRRPGLAKHYASVWLDYNAQQGPLEGFGAGIGVRYIGSMLDATNTVSTPAYTLIDAVVRYNWQDLQLSLNVRNLFDKNYRIGCYATRCYVGDPRLVTATATWRWR